MLLYQELMASQKLVNCCVAANVSLLRRTQVRLIAQHLRALHLTLFA
jgi:hypothetical protein